MSGGHFNYDQYKIGYIADEIEQIIRTSGKPKTKEELKEESWRDPEWYDKYPEDLYHYKYPDEVIQKFKEGLKIIRLAEIYTHRIDWLISGDDGEETFLKRLEGDINRLEEDLK